MVLIALASPPVNSGLAKSKSSCPGACRKLFDSERKPRNSLVAFDPAEYQVRIEGNSFSSRSSGLSFRVLRSGERPIPLFAVLCICRNSNSTPADPDLARTCHGLRIGDLLVQRPGRGLCGFRIGFQSRNREEERRAQLPLLLGPSGHVRLETRLTDLEILTGTIWAKSTADKLDRLRHRCRRGRSC